MYKTNSIKQRIKQNINFKLFNMNALFKTIRVVTDIVILAVMSLELKDQLEKRKLRKAEETVAAARATQEEIPNE